MIKKKKPRSYFKARWLTTLFLGISIGIASQHIPQVRAYTDEIIQPIEPQFTQRSTLPSHPTSFFLIHRPGYSLAYDARNKNPAWVYEYLTAESIKGDTDRSHFNFKEDESIPPQLRATLADYHGNSFDRGHQAPAANHRSSSQAMADTFYMSNMCPQCPQFNRGYWSKLEKHVRDLTNDYQNVYVVTGPLYLPYNEENGLRYVKYRVIGLNNVAVPTHFFKVIILERQGKKEARAYILPNEEIPNKTPLNNFRTTLQKVEKASGILFHKVTE